MVVDTSALIAILEGEDERDAFIAAMDTHDRCLIAAPTYLEAGVVLMMRRGPEAVADLDALLAAFGAAIVDFDESHARLARLAYERYGKGRHKAHLNLGDCMSYALAKSETMPLLFKGNDFRLTDVDAAL